MTKDRPAPDSPWFRKLRLLLRAAGPEIWRVDTDLSVSSDWMDFETQPRHFAQSSKTGKVEPDQLPIYEGADYSCAAALIKKQRSFAPRIRGRR